MCKRIIYFSFFLLVPALLWGQNGRKGYFRHPLNIPMELVSNFGEIRTNHWHMGLDIRTQQRENLPVFASAEGYIARVRVEPGGFGHAIYINHPNGLTTLYAHLNSFYPALDRYVKQQQYAAESWHIDLRLAPAQFPVAKGQQIALSGNTGGSAGPHVHFEIRETATDKVLNPLLFGFPIADAVPPSLLRLAMYDRNKSTYEQSPQLLSIANTRNSTIKVGSDKISFAIGAIDRFSKSNNPNGIYSARISVDDQPVSQFVLDRIDYNETRFMNAQIDYMLHARGGPFVQHISPLPGAAGVPYDPFVDNGLIVLEDTAPHRIDIEVKDAHHNTSRLSFKVQYDPSLKPVYRPPSAERLIPNQVNVFERPDFELFTTENAVYDSISVAYDAGALKTDAISAEHKFLNNSVPVHDQVTVRIRPAVELTEAQQNRVVIKNISGSRTYVQKGAWSNGWFTAKFRQFGSYQAFIDTEPPTVNAPPTDLSKTSRIVFTPADNFNTIKSFRAELNGKWLRFTNDKGKNWIYRFDEHFPRGSHELKVRVEDEAGNVTERTWKVRR